MPHSYAVSGSTYTLDLLLVTTPAAEITTLLNLLIFLFSRAKFSSFLILSASVLWRFWVKGTDISVTCFVYSLCRRKLYYYYYYPCYAGYTQLYTQTNHISTVYSVAAVLYLQFVLHVMLFRQYNMFCTYTLALPAVCVLCPIWLFFCSSLISPFPGMLLRYCVSNFVTVPVALLLPVSLLLWLSTCAEFLL